MSPVPEATLTKGGIRVEGGASLRGVVGVPGDKSISHRALLIAALAGGPSVISNLSPGEDVAATRRLIEALGASVEREDEGLRVTPRPAIGTDLVVDCANSGTTMRLGAGVAASRSGHITLTGDASLSRRPMERVIDPLMLMGARVGSRSGLPPLRVDGGELSGIDYEVPIPSAQVKGAVLFAGLHAAGETIVRERVATRRHTEEMLAAAGVDIDLEDGFVRLRPPVKLDGIDQRVPGDPSAAAFWVVAASICPSSEVSVEGVYLGPGRDDFLRVLGRMGADVETELLADGTFNLHVTATGLRGTEISDPREVAGCIDELPILAVAACFAEGVTTIAGADELRVKESDRLAAMAQGFRAMGASVQETPDGLVIEGRSDGLRGADVASRGDHRVAMSFAVAGLGAGGTTRISDWEAVAVSDPNFEVEMARVRT